MKKIIIAGRMAILFPIALTFAMPLCPRLFAEVDDHIPVGVTGIFNGNVTTGCSYDPLTHSAHRAIDDIVVSGSIGKYPLKMTRYYNSRGKLGVLGPGWSSEYDWFLSYPHGSLVTYPNGNVLDSYCQTPVGVSDGWESGNPATGTARFRLADGGSVVFTNYQVTSIIDPYGQTTTIQYGTNWMKVTEPAGRYLYFTRSDGVLTRVEAHGLGDATVTDWVNYSYTYVSPGGNGQAVKCLTRVDYSDGVSASYTYQQDNVPTRDKVLPLVATCNDVRYHGPMRQIGYDYEQDGAHGATVAERYSNNGVKGVTVSSIGPATDPTFPTVFTETRGDGPTRTFTYTLLNLHRDPEGGCPELIGSGPPSQFLLNYTDFQGHTTNLGYDANWYLNSVRDANNYTTVYERGPAPPSGIGQITKITHPDQTYIQYTYQDEGSGHISGHYLMSIRDERGNMTVHTRDGNHRITRTDYKDSNGNVLAYETFAYNGIGQVLMRRLKNGAYETFAYDGRGLLTDKWNPKFNSPPGGGDPHTHYDYYTSGYWTDRLQKTTLPANFPNNLQASETYEYDRVLGADGLTDPNGTAVTGRGLVTKTTHGDNTFQRFKYDAYGNKGWEDNELRQSTSYAYDDYNRFITVTNPLGKTTSYTYTPTNGGGGSPYKHTPNNADTITTPTQIVTKNVYDQNLRKTSSTAAYGTSLAATTWMHYDAVGNQDYVTDPRGSGSGDSAYTTYTDYDSRNRKWRIREPLNRTTEFHYDDGINVTRILRPDQTTETKTYDALNRVLTDTVPQTNSINLTTTFAYNPSGTIASVTVPQSATVNLTTSFLYDASDQKIQMTYPDGSRQQWAYDDAHNMKWRITVNGKTQQLCYDIRNRKYANWWSNWDDNINKPDWCYFGYDAASRLIEVENGTGGWAQNVISDVHRFYDAAGHLTTDQQIVTGLGTVSVNYAYDDDGKENRLWAPAGSYDYTFSYDGMGRFEKIFVTGNPNTLFQYYYDAASNETQRFNWSNRVTQIYTRDALNRLTRLEIKNTNTNATLGYENYGYDAMSRLTSVSREDRRSDSFSYYLDGELNTASYGATQRNVNYTLDRAGNRTSVLDNGTTKSYAPNPINQYTTAESSGVTNGLEHEIQAYNGVTYTYINDEHLQEVSDGTNSYSMTYDALGRCVKRALGPAAPNPTPTPVATYYVYDGEKPILEVGPGGTVVSNVYGKAIDEILIRTDPATNSGQAFFYQQDHEGSVTHLTNWNNGSGQIIERYRYDAFGAVSVYDGGGHLRSGGTAFNNRFLFTGREYAATYRGTYIPAFKFYEYRARAYNPILGRFMSEDPKGFVRRLGLAKAPADWSFASHPDEGEYNLFRYCGNDPVDFTDPLGLEVGFAESLIPVWGEGRLAYDAYNQGRYGCAAFHAAMAVTDVSGVKAIGNAVAKTTIKVGGKIAERQAIKAIAHESAIGYRYVGTAEANAIRETGIIPIVDANKQAKNVFFTNERFTTGAEAREALSLKNTPNFRIEFNLNQAPAGYGGLTEGGSVEFTLREGAQPIQADRMIRLDDPTSIDIASRHVPPKLDR